MRSHREDRACRGRTVRSDGALAVVGDRPRGLLPSPRLFKRREGDVLRSKQFRDERHRLGHGDGGLRTGRRRHRRTPRKRLERYFRKQQRVKPRELRLVRRRVRPLRTGRRRRGVQPWKNEQRPQRGRLVLFKHERQTLPQGAEAEWKFENGRKQHRGDGLRYAGRLPCLRPRL